MGQDRPYWNMDIEPFLNTPQMKELQLEELEKDLLEAFHAKMKIRPKIIWQEPGELERSTYKGKKFEKQYEET